MPATAISGSFTIVVRLLPALLAAVTTMNLSSPRLVPLQKGFDSGLRATMPTNDLMAGVPEIADD
jgi:hypothetical protein